MNTPNDTDLAALRAECNVLRLMLSLLVRDNVERDMLPGIGLERWCGPEMAAVVTGELGPHATPEQTQLHLDAFGRFCNSVCDADVTRRRRAAITGHRYADLMRRTGGDC
jgi:hypothetical protein